MPPIGQKTSAERSGLRLAALGTVFLLSGLAGPVLGDHVVGLVFGLAGQDAPGTAAVQSDPGASGTAGAPGSARTHSTTAPVNDESLRLEIPTLGVDAPVVGIEARADVLLPPDDPMTLGWWSDGARPGAAVGSALITGHTVSGGGGVFDDLEALQVGDEVNVQTTSGVTRYAVTEVEILRKAALARQAPRLFSQEVPGRLVLVTCEDWNGDTYLSNVVVLAQPLPQQ